MRKTLLFALLISLINVHTLFAVAGGSGEGGPVNTEEDIKEYIEHHLQDSHDFTLMTFGESGTHIGFSLPVILWSDGLHMFMSSKFEHGSSVAESNGKYFALYDGKVYETNDSGDIEVNEAGIGTNPRPLDFSITKNVVGMLLASLLLFLGFTSLARSYKTNSVPKGIGRFLEPLVIYVRDDIAKPNIGKNYEKYIGYLLTVFFYIWLMNLLGLTPLGFNITGNIAVTLCLAVITFIVVQFSANKSYWKHIFWMPNVPVLMKFVLMPIEILSMITKPFALLLRLFANITAGHFIVMSLIALMITLRSAFGLVASTGIAFALAFFITIIELLVVFLQAYIFTMLSALFIGMAVEEEH